MEVHIYSVKAKSQAVNICVKDIRKKAKAKRKSARDLKNLCFTIKFSRGPQVQEKALLGLPSINENTLPMSCCNFT